MPEHETVSFEGGTQPWTGSQEIQSGVLTSDCGEHISRINDVIRKISQQADPDEAVRQLGAILEKLTQSVELAQARARVLFGKVEPPPLAEAPMWLNEQLPALRESDEESPPVHPLAIETAALLIRACLNTPEGVNLTAEIGKGALARVEVDWDVSPHRLQWLIEASPIPWPGVKVYVLTRRGTGADAQRETRIFHNAFDVIEHFREHVRR